MCVSAKFTPARVTLIRTSSAPGSGSAARRASAPRVRRTRSSGSRARVAEAIASRAMSITVVGSIAFDSVKTPFGERERMLGGTAVHFSLASSFFADVHVVGPVGDDWGEAEMSALARPRRAHAGRRARPRRQDVLLARALRLRPQHRPHDRHPAGRLRRVRAQALGRSRARATCCSSRTSSPSCSWACASSASARGSSRWTR